MADETTVAEPGLSIALRKPIKAHGEDKSELTFREPTGADLLEGGNPIVVDVYSKPAVSFHEQKLGTMISRLANIPPTSVAQLHPADIVDIGWLIAPFFLPAKATLERMWAI